VRRELNANKRKTLPVSGANLYSYLVPPWNQHALRGEAGSAGPVTRLESRNYCCVSAEASFSACFAADLLSVELIAGLSV
jgi:hypothetical protein